MPIPGSRTLAAAAALAVVVALPACDRGPEPRVMVEGGAWTWFNDERAVVADGRLLVGYVDTAGFAGVAVTPLDGAGPARSYRLGSFRERDDHDNPSLLRLDDGRVLAAWAPHDTRPFWWWRHGTPAGDSVVWSPEQRTDSLGATVTYANLIRLAGEGGRVYDFFRGINFDPTVMTSDDGGETWSEPRHFLLAGTDRTRPYVKYASDGDGRIDFVYTRAHPRQARTHVYHAYYQDGLLHRSNGTAIQPMPGVRTAGGTHVGPMPVSLGTRVYHGAVAGRAWVWDLEHDSAGAPVAAYVAARDSTIGLDLRYRYARWDPVLGVWREGEIGWAGTRLYEGENHYAGGIAIDPADPSTVYASADVHPATGEPTDHYQIYRGRTDDLGASWRWAALTPDATTDHIRPFVTRGDGPRALLWLRGRYTSYTDFDTDVVGLVLDARPDSAVARYDPARDLGPLFPAVQLADTAGRRWLDLVRGTYRRTGQLMEKYDVTDLTRPAGGAE